jgi:hypothetical protein
MGRTLSQTERIAIINDLAAYREEELRAAGTGESDDVFVQRLRDVAAMDDDALIAHWRACLGEWLCSRDDVAAAYDGTAAEGDGDAIVAAELAKLLDPDQQTTYGFLGGRPDYRSAIVRK